MKKRVSFMVFVMVLLLTAFVNSAQAKISTLRAGTAITIPAYPIPRYESARGYWGRGWHRQMWAPGYWARPRYRYRPVIRMRAW